MKEKDDVDIYFQKGGQTISEISSNSGLSIPRRFDFGIGLRPCSICDAPRCLNRGCRETKQVICEECWPAYVSDSLNNGLYSAATSSPPSISPADEYLGIEDRFVPVPPSVDSLQMSSETKADSSRRDSCSQDSMTETTRPSEDRAEIDITDAIVSRSLKLCSVSEGALDDEDSAAESFMASVADCPNLSTGSVGSVERSNNRVKVVFFPGPLGIDFLKDMVTHVHEGNQADQLGVSVGWKLRKCNGRKCTSFRDRRIKDARKGHAPYELTFSTSVCDKDLDLLSSALDVPQNTDIDVSDFLATHVDDAHAQDSPESAVQSLSFLEAKLQEQQDEVEAVMAAVEEKASIASIRMSERVRRNSKEVPELVLREKDIIELGLPKELDAGMVSTQGSSFRDHRTDTFACDAPASFSHSCDELSDLQRERDQVESHLAELIEDEETLRLKISVLKADVDVVSEGNALASIALASIQEREHLARSRIAYLEAKLEAKEREVERNKRFAEKMIMQMQRQSQKRKDIQIEFEEAAFDPRSKPSVPSSLTCLTPSFAELCETCQAQDRKGKSWLERLFYVRKVISI